MLKFYMIEEIGTVRSTQGGVAIVDVPMKSACEGCTAGLCKPEEKHMQIEAFNRAGAVPGQKVRVAVQASSYMKGSMVVYGLPALGLILGAVFGKEILGRLFPAFDPDVLSAAAGFTSFCISFIIVRVWSNFAGKKTESKPVIEEILN